MDTPVEAVGENVATDTPCGTPSRVLLPTDAAALRELFVAEIRAVNPQLLSGPGMFFGLNQMAVSGEPPHTRTADKPLLVAVDEAEWKKLLCQFKQLGFSPPKNLPIGDGTAENYSVELYDVLPNDQPVVARYWALELADNNGEGGPKGNSGEPRSQLLCGALTGHTFAYPYYYIYAHLTLLPDGEEAVAEAEAEAEAEDPEPSTFDGLKRGFLKTLPEAEPAAVAHKGKAPHTPDQNARSGGEDVPVWKLADAPAHDPEDARDPEDMRAQAVELRAKAQAQASLGDHKTAYATAADAISLQVRASRAEETMAISGVGAPVEPPSRPETPEPTEPAAPAELPELPELPALPAPSKTYFPATEYLYPDGHTRTVAAGMYTQDEFITRTMEEQARWAGAMEAFQQAAAHESDGEGEGEEV